MRKKNVAEQNVNNSELKEYYKAYYANETDANKRMSIALALTSIVLTMIYVCFLVKIFIVARQTFIIINIIFPICIILLVVPMFLIRTKMIERPRYKIFVLGIYILVISVFNIFLPKHSLYGWAIVIALSNHYYNPKLGLRTYIFVVTLMLVCMFGGMFFGEYDPYLLAGQSNEYDGTIHHFMLENVYQDTPQGRIEYLHDLIQVGQNRYIKMLLQYYLPRAILVSVIFYISNALNKRTSNLLRKEIVVGINQQKTKTELEVAKEIQLTTLPTDFITNQDIEIQAELMPAREVGGDFYDYFILNNHEVAIVIGDVSGKGIPAAMFMMKTITCFKNFVNLYKSPAEILRAVNKTIYAGNESKMFVTCFLAIVNTETGEMRYANAGHNPPIVGQKTKYNYLKCNSGFILGGLPEAIVKDETYQFNAGDTITLYTDGITEAMSTTREQFGEERLINFFNKKEYSCILELHKELRDAVEEFSKGAEQSDDMTYLTLKYHGDNYFYLEKIFPGVMEEIPNMLDFLRDFGIKNNFDDSYINKGMIIADELLSNIVKYGYKDYSGSIYIRILHNIDKKELILTIIDNGIEFNQFEVDNRPLNGDITNAKEGGLGILIVKQMMSEYAYDRVNGKNIVVIKKRF